MTNTTGRAKGGVARFKSLTQEQRREFAQKGAAARWAVVESETETGLPVAKYGAPGKPLRLAHIEIPCYVLSDGTRVLVQRGLQGGLGLSEGGGKRGARKIVGFLESLAGKGIDISDLIARDNNPIRFIPPHGGNPADGYEATILPDLCDVLIEAGRRVVLRARSAHLAERAALLQHPFAPLGIMALVDEATAHHAFSPQGALHRSPEKALTRE